MAYELNSATKVRAAFWRECSGEYGVSRKRITAYSGKGKMYNTDTRCAFVNWLDNCAKSDRISPQLAMSVTLGR